MQIRFQGQITKKDYRNAIEMNFSGIKWWKWICGFFLVIILFSFTVTISSNSSIGPTYFLPIIIFPLIFLSFPWWTIYIQAASFEQKGNIYRTPINGVIDDTGISINGQETKSSSLWKAYTHYKKNDGMVLLYQGKSCFNIFTPGLFSNEDDWKQFIEELNVKIKGDNK